jgi:hypothetical protein
MVDGIQSFDSLVLVLVLVVEVSGALVVSGCWVVVGASVLLLEAGLLVEIGVAVGLLGAPDPEGRAVEPIGPPVEPAGDVVGITPPLVAVGTLGLIVESAGLVVGPFEPEPGIRGTDPVGRGRPVVGAGRLVGVPVKPQRLLQVSPRSRPEEEDGVVSGTLTEMLVGSTVPVLLFGPALDTVALAPEGALEGALVLVLEADSVVLPWPVRPPTRDETAPSTPPSKPEDEAVGDAEDSVEEALVLVLEAVSVVLPWPVRPPKRDETAPSTPPSKPEDEAVGDAVDSVEEALSVALSVEEAPLVEEAFSVVLSVDEAVAWPFWEAAPLVEVASAEAAACEPGLVSVLVVESVGLVTPGTVEVELEEAPKRLDQMLPSSSPRPSELVAVDLAEEDSDSELDVAVGWGAVFSAGSFDSAVVVAVVVAEAAGGFLSEVTV